MIEKKLQKPSQRTYERPGPPPCQRGSPCNACIEKFDMGHVVPKPCLKKKITLMKKGP